MTIETTPLYSLNETGEERLALEVSVVLLEVVLGSVDELHGDELVSSLLESADDLADESSLDLVVAKKRTGARGGGRSVVEAVQSVKQLHAFALHDLLFIRTPSGLTAMKVCSVAIVYELE